VDVWITEIGVDPREHGIRTRHKAHALKTKFCLRSVLFYLGIGTARVYVYHAVGDADGMALVSEATPTAATPPLRTLARALGLIRGPAKRAFEGPVRKLSFEIFSSERPKVLFAGDGTSGAPNLLATDCLVLLPFQSAPGRIVIACYVMTRDIQVDMGPESVRIRIAGVAGTSANAWLYDPVGDLKVPCSVEDRNPDRVTLQIEVTDSPRLLVLQEDGA
jgi:hypothetical protein